MSKMILLPVFKQTYTLVKRNVYLLGWLHSILPLSVQGGMSLTEIIGRWEILVPYSFDIAL